MSTTYRTKTAIYLENSIYEWLKNKNQTTDIPQSRIIEKALVEVYGNEIEEFKKSHCKEE